ncbi:MAG: DUF1127 domain-containing protein [Pseudomonadota bacterium]
MTTYLDLQTAGSHFYPFEFNPNHWSIRLVAKVREMMAASDRAQLERELRSMPDHLLRDMGIERHMLVG